MLVKCFAAAIQGIKANTITIEVDLSQGINFFLVGLPDSAVKESHRRIESAMRSCGYDIPKKRLVINMAPADFRKEGSAFDLPLAIGILAAAGKVSVRRLKDFIIMGELSLDARIGKIRGALPIAIHAQEAGFGGIILPEENLAEASAIKNIDVFGMKNLDEVVAILNGHSNPDIKKPKPVYNSGQQLYGMDFSDVRGQANVKRALEIAAAGNHNLLMVGSPGSGKSMLAKRIPTVLPSMTVSESIETTRIHSVAGKLNEVNGLIRHRPFRHPHHTISDTAMVGGGSWPQPGEISLAHNGILFLDELPEFRRNVLEALRQPMEDRKITVSRANYSAEFPASFMLVASMNPCPCGYYGHPSRECDCPPGAVQRYLSRISGPLLDRIDIHIHVTPVHFSELTAGSVGADKADFLSSKEIRNRVNHARKVQAVRFSDHPGIHNNSQIIPGLMKSCCRPDNAAVSLLRNAMERLELSARAYDRILKVARTIADMDGSSSIRSPHLAEAINLRSLDRKGWC